VKYLNNIVGQDHRNLKRLTRPGLGFGSFWTAQTNTGPARSGWLGPYAEHSNEPANATWPYPRGLMGANGPALAMKTGAMVI